MKRWFAPFAAGMVLVYAALAVSAAGCLVLQAEESGHAHHTPSHAAHSTLCAWVCQVNPTVSIQAVAPLLAFFAVVVMQRLVGAAPPLHFMSAVSRSRAPPQ
jgi:pentose-5-phosphate-3-epimerase